jgi:murein DD-endopeptidase MepM/ murein hydrolase activator NlpD
MARSTPGSDATGSASPAPLATLPAPAPTSAVGFRPRTTVVPILFPLSASASYRYGDAWRVPRLGIVYAYNQIHGVGPGSVLLRAHDGVDLQVRIGTPVLAPFAGVVIDPRPLWKPWDPGRYGKVVVIRSTEATSRGYAAILVHLSVQNVRIGDSVSRGQIVGRTGTSGNASETIPHLHFELRAPFQIEFHYAGVTRFLDSFDPLPSLLAADPKR